MLRLRRLTDYGTVILAQLAAMRGGWTTVSSIAQATRLPEATVGKLLKQLTHQGLAVSQRGTHGGYRLSRDPADISALEILESLEGSVAVTECSLGNLGCNHAGYCRVRTPWQTINEAIRRTLAGITLAELAAALPIPALDMSRSAPRSRNALPGVVQGESTAHEPEQSHSATAPSRHRPALSSGAQDSNREHVHR